MAEDPGFTEVGQFDRRKSGVPLIRDLPWGSHFCQFYQTKKDLLDILVPYFTMGLNSNEFCLWAVSAPVDVNNAKKALKKAFPHFEEFEKSGQIEIFPHTSRETGAWANTFITSKLDQAISKGFEGLRMARRVFPQKKAGGTLKSYAIDAIGKYPIIAAYLYPRNSFDAVGLMEVVRNHRYALIRNAGNWEVIESSEATIKDALRQSEEKLHSLFHNMSEAFAYHRIVLNSRGEPCDYILLETNEAFEKLTGIKNAIGKKATEVLPGLEKDPTDWIGKYGKVALEGKPAQFESYAEPLEKWYSVSAFSQRKGYFAVIFSDITERKNYEENLRRTAQELARSNQELEQFAYVASHDLQEPLRMVSGFMGLLNQRYGNQLDEKATQYVKFAMEGADRMAQLIQDLLAYSRVQSGALQKAQVDMNYIFDRILINCTQSIQESAAHLIKEDLPLIDGDLTQLGQLMQNLVVNAIKFRRPGVHPEIRVTANRAADSWLFCVQDNGIGIPAEESERIFMIFRRLHTRQEYPGTGIGLAICKKIVERHGGKIWVESTPGLGSKFLFTLPYA